MVSAEWEPITGAWDRAPSGIQGQSPWSGGQGAKAPEAESLLAFQRPMKAKKLPHWLFFFANWQFVMSLFKYSLQTRKSVCMIFFVFTAWCTLVQSTVLPW